MRIALPEQISIDLKLAGFGSRALAYIADWLLRWFLVGLLVLGILYLFSFFAASFDFSDLFDAFDFDADNFGLDNFLTFVFAIIVAVLYFFHFCYYIYFEMRHRGVTPGKKLFGLRVVDETGLPLSFRASMLRFLFLVIDMMPMLGMTALVAMMVSKKSQRVGDLVAKTIVIYDLKEESLESLSGSTEEQAKVLIPLKHYNLLEDYIKRRDLLRPEARAKMGIGLKNALLPLVTSLAAELASSSNNFDRWLDVVFKNSQPQQEDYQDGASR